MKKSLLIAAGVLFGASVFAQESPAADAPKKKTKTSVNLSNRANDHFMIQFGYAGWSGKPDSINLKGLPRTGNVYFMFDFPFKTNPKLSMAVGAGIGTDNIYFDKMDVQIKETNPTLRFKNLKDTSYYKKYKLTTAYLEAPIEFRYVAKPEQSDKSFKFAIGAKVGTLLNAKTKGKKFYDDATGNTLDYTIKTTSKRFFNSTRFSVTARVGYGNFSLYGSYQVNAFLKEGVGPDVRPYSVGLTFSGL